jgi:hypothetical protein
MQHCLGLWQGPEQQAEATVMVQRQPDSHFMVRDIVEKATLSSGRSFAPSKSGPFSGVASYPTGNDCRVFNYRFRQHCVLAVTIFSMVSLFLP